MKRETSISRRSLLVGTACAALGALTGCTAPEPTAEEPHSGIRKSRSRSAR